MNLRNSGLTRISVSAGATLYGGGQPGGGQPTAGRRRISPGGGTGHMSGGAKNTTPCLTPPYAIDY